MNKIGFIGLGHMGLPMAVGLLKSGFDVMAFDMNPDALQAFLNQNGQITTDLCIMAQQCCTMITMLPSGQQLLDIYAQEQAFIQHVKPKSLLIDCSTVGPLAAKRWHEIAKKHQLLSVDAPVSGGVNAAKQGTLTFMLGGDLDAVTKAKQILSKIGQRLIETGEACSGQTAKICNNMILANNMITLSEAFLLAQSLHLSKEKFLEVVQHSSGNSWVVEKYLPIENLIQNVPANTDYQPGFSGHMMLKDLTLAEQTCASVDIHLPLTQASLDIYSDMVEANFGEKDFSFIYQFLKQKLQP
jgi:3-hydroxyisobutyrate dehydrogenase